MRTDSTRTSSSSRDTAKEFIVTKWGDGFLGKGVIAGKPKSNVQDAHEAIRPTNPKSELPNGLGLDLSKFCEIVHHWLIQDERLEPYFFH